MIRGQSTFALFLAAVAASSLTGCAPLGTSPSSVATVSHAATFSGSLHGGQSPVSLASVQLYAVGTGGDGSAPTALLAAPVLSDIYGDFTLTGLYRCPSASTLVYLVATGGNPGLTLGTNNTALTMVNALGACGTLSAATFATVDEVTTVAAAAALYPFTSAPYNIGSSSSDLPALQAAFSLAQSLANPLTGFSPGAGQNLSSSSSPTVPSAEINTLANALSYCVNSTGSTAPMTPCGMLFPVTGSPANIFTAAVNVESNPTTYSASSIFGLVTTNGPFQPTLTTSPSTFAIAIMPASITAGTFGTSPSAGPVGSTVVIQRAGLPGACTFVPPLSVNFDSAAAAGSFTSSTITVTVPYGAPPGLDNGTIANPAGTCTFAFYVTGSPLYGLSPSGLQFSSQPILTQSASLQVTITNDNAYTVTVDSVATSGGSASSFLIAYNGCGATLAAGASCMVNVAFAPQGTGTLNSNLAVSLNGAFVGTGVALSGTGI